MHHFKSSLIDIIWVKNLRNKVWEFLKESQAILTHRRIIVKWYSVMSDLKSFLSYLRRVQTQRNLSHSISPDFEELSFSRYGHSNFQYFDGDSQYYTWKQEIPSKKKNYSEIPQKITLMLLEITLHFEVIWTIWIMMYPLSTFFQPFEH